MKKSKERSTTFDDFVTDIVTAVDKYGEDHVDAIIDKKRDFVYLTYHSSNNSFSLSKNYPLSELNAIDIADRFNIGWSEI